MANFLQDATQAVGTGCADSAETQQFQQQMAFCLCRLATGRDGAELIADECRQVTGMRLRRFCFHSIPFLLNPACEVNFWLGT